MLSTAKNLTTDVASVKGFNAGPGNNKELPSHHAAEPILMENLTK
jgi:hypothetical protein